MTPRTSAQFGEIRAKSREKIILAAMQMFAQKTFHNTTVSDISKAAGISKGLIYNYFETKEDILKGIIEYMFSIGDKIMEESLNKQTPKDELCTMIEQIFTYLDKQSAVSRMLIPLALELGNFNYVNDVIEQKMENYLPKLTDIMQKLGFEDAEMEAMALGVLFDGISLDYNVMGKKFPAKRIQQYLYKRYGL
ncbi:MAG: TetR/AcrR family transcriptional regulator [Chitinophagales bacterium]